jgi:hypothetical protein
VPTRIAASSGHPGGGPASLRSLRRPVREFDPDRRVIAPLPPPSHGAVDAGRLKLMSWEFAGVAVSHLDPYTAPFLGRIDETKQHAEALLKMYPHNDRSRSRRVLGALVLGIGIAVPANQEPQARGAV